MLKTIDVFTLWLLFMPARLTKCQAIASSPSCSKNFLKPDDTIDGPVNLKDYGDHVFCNYAITVATMKQVSLKGEQVQLYSAAYSLWEYVVVFDGPDCTAKRIGVIHGNQKPTIISSNNRMTALLVLHSSYNIAKFRATYSTVTGKNRTEPVSPRRNNRILDDCGDVLSDRSGKFSFKGDERSNALCIWKIKVADGGRVRVRFSRVKIGLDGAWLRVLDGDDCGAPVMQFINESQTKPYSEFTSTSNVMLVVYASPSSSETAQIEADYWEEVNPTTTTGTMTPISETNAAEDKLVPSLPRDLVTDLDEMVNNPAVSNEFNLISNWVGYAIAGVIILLLKLV